MLYSTKHIDELYKNISLDLNVLSDCFEACEVSHNVNKTSYMIFASSKIHANPEARKIGTKAIEQTNTTTFLGNMIDDKLN
jgi:hypothetical protein